MSLVINNHGSQVQVTQGRVSKSVSDWATFATRTWSIKFLANCYLKTSATVEQRCDAREVGLTRGFEINISNSNSNAPTLLRLG